MVPAAVVLSSLSKEETRRRFGTGPRMSARSSPGTGREAAKSRRRTNRAHQFDPSRPLRDRYAAKADEVGVDERTVRRWVKAYEENGEAGLVPARFALQNRIDPRWSEAALAIMR